MRLPARLFILEEGASACLPGKLHLKVAGGVAEGHQDIADAVLLVDGVVQLVPVLENGVHIAPVPVPDALLAAGIVAEELEDLILLKVAAVEAEHPLDVCDDQGLVNGLKLMVIKPLEMELIILILFPKPKLMD